MVRQTTISPVAATVYVEYETDECTPQALANNVTSLGVAKSFLPATTRPIPHLVGPGVEHPRLEAVRG